MQKAKLEQDAKAAVSASWRDLCDEQQQRIDQMRTHIEAMEARLAKTQGIAETLQQEVIVLRLENADLRVQVRTLERQHVEREGRFVALEQENERLRGGRVG